MTQILHHILVRYLLSFKFNGFVVETERIDVENKAFFPKENPVRTIAAMIFLFTITLHVNVTLFINQIMTTPVQAICVSFLLLKMVENV